jgi:hypothetical protein
VAKIKKSKKSSAAAQERSILGPAEKRSFSPDRKGEASAGALSSKDKKRAVAATRDGSNNR